MTYVCGLTHAAGAGILIRGGEHLETLAKVGVVAIDKTGTLTEGRFQVQNLLVLSGADRTKVLSTLLAVEHRASHPMAPALVAYARVQLGPALADEAILEAQGMQIQTMGGEGVTRQATKSKSHTQIDHTSLKSKTRLFHA